MLSTLPIDYCGYSASQPRVPRSPTELYWEARKRTHKLLRSLQHDFVRDGSIKCRALATILVGQAITLHASPQVDKAAQCADEHTT